MRSIAATEVAEVASRARINVALSRQDVCDQPPLVLPQEGYGQVNVINVTVENGQPWNSALYSIQNFSEYMYEEPGNPYTSATHALLEVDLKLLILVSMTTNSRFLFRMKHMSGGKLMKPACRFSLK
ncbi:MAG: hypothetical protein IRD7MM_00780 [Candidatus Midichloria mitochondrii]|nr:hypothetical protein [Candidatus Midichloria mitochondrii]MDJ1288282.1 hypothetical protein [Candidatus Midichloria mitochondrii]MDJ1299141.1 hypothetical protein [Candidatus Midichloria mitochondrii]MDJ1583753.1 hypothetical protein [Candidatus Midichloria mitochondrii]